MVKLSLLLILLVGIYSEANGVIKRDKQIELTADTLSGTETLIQAKGHVKLIYNNNIILANYARFNKIKKLLTIAGDVEIINADGSSLHTDEISLSTKDKKVELHKVLYSSRDSIWISSPKITKQNSCYAIEKGKVSSCLTDNPDWHIEFSKANYNSKTEKIKLDDVKFYIADIPIFYLPYISFSTSQKRKSGLLMPHVSYSQKEGLVYEQPIYMNIASNIDMELNPQIRTDRSAGIYATINFVDSNHSKGYLRGGYFKDKDSYTSLYNLSNNSHYGLEAHYESSAVLAKIKPYNYLDSLYLDLILFNDIDYINLQKTTIDHLADSYIKESKLNYSLYNDKNFIGVESSYYKDAKEQSNSNTLHKIPSFRWHKSRKNLFGVEALDYSIDSKVSNYIKDSDISSNQFELNIPIEYDISFLSDYIHMQIGEDIYINNSRFYHRADGTKDYDNISLTHSLKLYGDMIKPYNNGMHTVEWSLKYAKQSNISSSVEEYNKLDIDIRRDIISKALFDQKIDISLKHYWYSNNMELYASQSVSQTYYPNDIEKWDSFRNEFEIRYKYLKFINLVEYSYRYNDFSEISNRIEYNSDRAILSLDRFWRKDLQLDTILTNEVAFEVDYQYDKELNLFAGFTYDLENSYSKKWKIGFRYNRSCWNMELGYLHDTQPLLTNNGSSSIDNDKILFKLNLLAFGAS